MYDHIKKITAKSYIQSVQLITLLVESLRGIYSVSRFTCNLLIIAIIISGIFPGVFIKTTSDIIQVLSEGNVRDSTKLIFSFSIRAIAILTQNLISPIIL
jgi:hypothetical protein